MDFRVGFGGSFGQETAIVVVGAAPPDRTHPRAVAAELYGDVAATLAALAVEAGGGDARDRRAAWLEELR